MIKTTKVGRGKTEKSISVMEVPPRKSEGTLALVMITSGSEEAGLYLSREQLQEHNANVAEVIAQMLEEENKDGE